MITIKKSPTADTRTCDSSKVTLETLAESSNQHIKDVGHALTFFCNHLLTAGARHDFDKLESIEWFHREFKGNFVKTGWWDRHRQIHRHHLNYPDGIPADVNLLDVLEYISDCVMAGMARSGTVTEIKIAPDVLAAAFVNTVAMLKCQVKVEPEEQYGMPDPHGPYLYDQ